MTTPKFFNLAPSADGASLEIAINGTIDPMFATEGDTSSAEIAAQLAAHKSATHIHVTINSLGGSLAGGVALYNLLRGHGSKVTTLASGLAASAAGIIFLAGDERIVGKGAMLMLHEPVSATMGTATDHRKQAEVLDVARDALASIIVDRTGKALDEVKALLAAETWYTAEQAVAENIATSVAGEPVRVTAHADGIMLAGQLFARADLPAAILALAGELPAVAQAPEPAADPAPPAKAAPSTGVEGSMTGFSSVDLLGAMQNGQTQGVTAERARIVALLDLGVVGHAQVVRAAILDGKTPEQLIMAVHLADVASKVAQNKAGAAWIEARRRESQLAASIRPSSGAPERVGSEEAQAAKAVAKLVNDDQRRR